MFSVVSQRNVLLLLLVLLGCVTSAAATGSVSAAATGSVSPETLCVCPGDEATFTCSVERSGGVFAWVTNTTTETCKVFSSSPQSQCGQFIGQLQNGSLSTLTATSAATSDTGNIHIQCHYIVYQVGNVTLLIGGTPPTPILHNVTSGDILYNGDVDTRDVNLRWTLSEPDNCLNTMHFNVTPDDPTHCGSCEVGPGGPGVQEEFSCQVIQGIGQSCTYRVYAIRCGDTLNGVVSEPVEVNLTGIVVEFDPSSYTVNEDDRSVTFMIVKRTPTILSVTVNFSTVPGTAKDSVDYVPKNMSEVTFAPSETVRTVRVIIVNDNTTEPQEMFSGRLTPVSPVVDIGQGEAAVVIVDDDMTSSSSHPPPVTSSSLHPPSVTSSSSHPPSVTSSSLHPPPVTSSSPHPPPVTSRSPHPLPVSSSSSHPPSVTSSSPHPPPIQTTSSGTPEAPTETPGSLTSLTTGPGALPTTGPGTLPTTSPGILPTTSPGALPTTSPGALPTTSPGALPTSSPGEMDADVDDSECSFCWYYIPPIVIPVLLLIAIITVIVCIVFVRRKANKRGAWKMNAAKQTPQNTNGVLSEIALPDIGVELSNHVYYADPDEFLRKDNIYSADPKTSRENGAAAADDSNQLEDHPEDHIPTYADPRTIEREAAPETGDAYTLVDMSKKNTKNHPPVMDEENPYELVEIERSEQVMDQHYAVLNLFQDEPQGVPPTEEPVQYSMINPSAETQPALEEQNKNQTSTTLV